MIDSSTLNAHPATNSPENSHGPSRPRLYMRRDPDARMAGSIPVWENPKQSAQQSTDQPADFKTTMNYADMEPAAGNEMPEAEDDSFGFGDLIDIVNPLHHIPLVSTIYEGITGDTIRPSGQIIGGAIYGGFVGAAAGIANVILEEETGKDMSGNVVALVTQGQLPQMKRETLSPEEHLNQAARMAFNDIEAEALPPMAMGMRPVRTQEPSPVVEYERYTRDEDRMAGTRMRARQHADSSPLPRTALADPVSINLAAIRSDDIAAVTQVKLSPLPDE